MGTNRTNQTATPKTQPVETKTTTLVQTPETKQEPPTQNEKKEGSGSWLDSFKTPFEAQEDEDTALKSAKFVKAVSFFNNTPTVFLSGYFLIPRIIDGVQTTEQLDISGPPYNIIKSFNFDTVEGKIEIEMLDAAGTLLTKLMTNFLGAEKFSGSLSIGIRYGWSHPGFPIKGDLFEDVLDPKPKKFIKSKGSKDTTELKPRVRFTDFVTVLVEDIEIEWTTSGAVLKISGTNKLETRVTPAMAKFTPYSKLGPYPFASEGLIESVDEIKEILDKNPKDIEEVIKNLKKAGIISDDIWSDLKGVILSFINDLKQIKTAGMSEESKRDLVTDRIEKWQKEIDSMQKINSEGKNVFKASQFFDFLMSRAKTKTMSSWAALKEMINIARRHADYLGKEIYIVPLIFLTQTKGIPNFAPPEQTKDKEKQKDDLLNKIEVKNFVIDPSTSYEEVFKRLAAAVKITTKRKTTQKVDKNGKTTKEEKTENITTSLLFSHFVAFGKDEIEKKIKDFLDFVLKIPEKETQRIVLTEFFKSFETLKKLDKEMQNRVMETTTNIGFRESEKNDVVKILFPEKGSIFNQNSKVIFYIFSEYATDSFFSDVKIENVLHSYSYRPAGFQMGLASGSIGGGKLRTSLGTLDDLNYFNTGTLNYVENNFPDVISFSPKLSYRQIQTAAAGLTKGILIDIPGLLFTSTEGSRTLTQDQKDALSAEQVKEFEKAKATMQGFNFDKYLQAIALPNSNAIYSNDSSATAVRARAAIENFKKILVEKLVGFEAELKILGEPFFDKTQLSKLLFLNIYGPDGRATFFSGYYRISGISHSIEAGRFETTIKLIKDTMPATEQEKISTSPAVTPGNGGGDAGAGGKSKNPTGTRESKKWYVLRHVYNKTPENPSTAKTSYIIANYTLDEINGIRKAQGAMDANTGNTYREIAGPYSNQAEAEKRRVEEVEKANKEWQEYQKKQKQKQSGNS